ncbi:acetyl-CoA carboxylase biotin carboxyl carrier protein [Jiangella endophytica]|uniref:acetyl-CoA carboxylase biotin carboxyl carrier protein n=1 Tax=Jiangella endophytica TaxID=1623398 RepID=UPI000E346882|nr:acetyl-CoA carboxylase biotin carboxyl carrier protein subunit [Jiangella endophytica]
MTAAPARPQGPHDTEPDSERAALVSHLRVEAAALVGSLTGRVQRVQVSAGDCSIAVEWVQPQPQPALVAGQPVARAEPFDAAGDAVAAADGSDLRPDTHALRAPLIGAFYRSPVPDADPFVEVGDRVEAGQTVAIVEAMKLMNEIKADRAGRVAAIHPANGQMVEFDEILVELTADD